MLAKMYNMAMMLLIVGYITCSLFFIISSVLPNNKRWKEQWKKAS